MRIASVGGGPAGLYFAILMKRADPRHEVVVFERNRADDTFGFGVVFSDATLDRLAEADPETLRRIRAEFAHWDDIDVHYRGQVLSSTGHGFAGLGRMKLLEILSARCEELGVDLRFSTEVRDFDALSAEYDLVLGADGVNSAVRAHWADRFRPRLDWRPNRFVWLGTSFPFEAFTFYFKADQAGLWRVHAYRYAEDQSTFIVECTDETFERSGLEVEDEAATVAYFERLFAEELAGHGLQRNRSVWRQFPTITNGRWSHENVVLMGDAVHTAHFSIGSGTKLAMEDAIALRDALLETPDDVRAALAAYESGRRDEVERLQRSAQVSLEWFENTERYMDLEPEAFAFSLLTRSLRVTHENLQLRDPEMVDRVDRWFARRVEGQLRAELPRHEGRVPPPLFTPLKLRDLVLPNRVVVSPMCQYRAVDGVVNDWHLVHLGSRAVGGAGLIIAEMTAISPEARITPGCAGLWNQEQVAAWRRVVDFVHAESGAKIGIQLGHAGRKGATCLPWAGGYDVPLERGGWPLLSASPLPWSSESVVPREMDEADMDRAISDYQAAARRAEAAGFDLLEVHLAHGYLLACFVSPLTNQRQDAWGGDLAGRARFPLEVVRAVRAVWPSHKPLSVRISATDWRDGGLSGDDAVELSRRLADAGVDIIDVSAGQTVPDQAPRYGRLFQTPFSDRIKNEAGVRTMTVGNVQSYTDVNSILAAGRADLCVLARAHLYDPYWTRHAAQHLGWPSDWPEPYQAVARYNPRFV